MTWYLDGFPDSTWYFRAIFIAASVASEPPDTKNTRSHTLRGHIGDLPGQVDLRLADELAVGEGDLPGLIGHGLGDFLHAVAYADHVHAGTGVQVGPAAGVVQVAPAAV